MADHWEDDSRFLALRSHSHYHPLVEETHKLTAENCSFLPEKTTSDA